MNAALGRPSDKYGAVGSLPDGKDYVIFERHLHHSVDRVWAAFTDAEQREKWVPGIQFEAKPGGRYEIWFGDECEGPAHVSGTLTAFDPPKVIALGSIRFELEAEGDQGCLLRFSDILWYDEKRTKTQFANAVLGGWHRFLDQFELWLDDGLRVLSADLPEPHYAEVDVGGRP